MADFLEVMNSGSNKITLNISKIINIKATTKGCIIVLPENNSLSLNVPYKDIKQAIQEAYNSDFLIHSIVDDNLPDATPPRPITVY